MIHHFDPFPVSLCFLIFPYATVSVVIWEFNGVLGSMKILDMIVLMTDFVSFFPLTILL